MKAKMLTTKEVAALLGVSTGRVHQIAKDRGVEPDDRIGVAKLWRRSTVRLLKPRASGAAGHRPKNPGK
jgi:hypothetical protein